MKKTHINIAHLNGNFFKHKYNMNYIPSFVSNLKHSQGCNPAPFQLNIKNKFILNKINTNTTNKKIQFNNDKQNNNFIQHNYETNHTSSKHPTYIDNNNTTNPTLTNKNYEELLKEKDQQIAHLQKRLLLMQHTIAHLKQDNTKIPLNSSVVRLMDNNNNNNNSNSSITQSKRQSYREGISSNIIVHSLEESKHGSYNSLPSTPRKPQMKLKKTFSLKHHRMEEVNSKYKEQCNDLKSRANDLLNNYYKHILYIDSRKCVLKNEIK